MSYFKRKKTNAKCSKCAIKTKGLSELKLESNVLYESGSKVDMLIVCEMPEPDSYIGEFTKILKNKGFNSFRIISALKCRSKNFELPNPVYKLFNNCNCVKPSNEYKVIISVGRSISAITKSSDIFSWSEFCEYKFNPTYFYTGLNWDKKIRVYPISGFVGWMYKDNFDRHFAIKQLNFIKQYLNDYKEEKLEPYKVEIVEDTVQFFKDNNHQTEMALDTETTGLDIYDKDFRCRTVTISFDGITGYYLKFEDINKRQFSTFLKGKEIYFANGKYDCKVLERVGVRNVVISEDIVILFHLLNTVRVLNGLKTIAWFLGLGGYDAELDEYWKNNKGITWATIPHTSLYNYAAMDAIVTYRATKYLRKLAEKQPDVYKLYKEVIIQVLPIFQSMETNGMEVDLDYVNQLHNKLDTDKKVIEEKIKKIFDVENINSHEQLSKAIELAGWKDQGVGVRSWEDEKGKKHSFYKVGEPQLSRWLKDGYEEAQLILDYRALETLDKTFVGHGKTKIEETDFFSRSKQEVEKEKGIIQYISSYDKKIHGTINPARTDTWRASSSNPNLQNQPKQGEEGKRFRPCYKCPDDYLICEADYSGFQLRIGAIYSKDETMKDIFINHGGDIHSLTGQAIFARDKTVEEFLSLKGQEPYKTMRFNSKCINFGFIFGMAAYTFSSTIQKNWTEDQVQEYINTNNLEIVNDKNENPDLYLTVATDMRDKFFSTYSKLLPWIASQHSTAIRNGYVDSYHGARRHTPELLYEGSQVDYKQKAGLLNIAVNSPVQAFEAIEIYSALIRCYSEFNKRNLKSKFVAMVHDSVVLYVHKDELKEVALILKDNMETDKYSVPIEIEVEYGSIWGFGDEIDFSNIDDSINEIVQKNNPEWLN